MLKKYNKFAPLYIVFGGGGGGGGGTTTNVDSVARAQAAAAQTDATTAITDASAATTAVDVLTASTGDSIPVGGSVWSSDGFLMENTTGAAITLSGDTQAALIADGMTNAVGAAPVAGSVDAASIQDGAVSNAKAADMPALTFKGNDTGAAADPKDLTVMEATRALQVAASFSSAEFAADVTAFPDGTIIEIDGFTCVTKVGTAGNYVSAVPIQAYRLDILQVETMLYWDGALGEGENTPLIEGRIYQKATGEDDSGVTNFTLANTHLNAPVAHIGIPVAPTANAADNLNKLNQAILDSAASGLPVRTSGGTMDIAGGIEIVSGMRWISDHTFKINVNYTESNGVVSSGSGLGTILDDVIMDGVRLEATTNPATTDIYMSQMFAGRFHNSILRDLRVDMFSERRAFHVELVDCTAEGFYLYQDETTGTSGGGGQPGGGFRVVGGSNTIVKNVSGQSRDDFLQVVPVPGANPLFGFESIGVGYADCSGTSLQGRFIIVQQSNSTNDGTLEATFPAVEKIALSNLTGKGFNRMMQIVGGFNGPQIKGVTLDNIVLDASDKDVTTPYFSDCVLIAGNVDGVVGDVTILNPNARLLSIGPDVVHGNYTAARPKNIDLGIFAPHAPGDSGTNAEIEQAVEVVDGCSDVTLRPKINWNKPSILDNAIINVENSDDVTIQGGWVKGVQPGVSAIRFDTSNRSAVLGMSFEGSGNAIDIDTASATTSRVVGNDLGDMGFADDCPNVEQGNTGRGAISFSPIIGIVSGVLTINGSGFYRINTEGDAATDDVDTINGGTHGDTIYLQQQNNGRDPTYTTAGNIDIPASITPGASDVIQGFIYDGNASVWKSL